MKEVLINQFEADCWEIPMEHKKMLVKLNIWELTNKLNEWRDWYALGGKLTFLKSRKVQQDV